MGVPDFCEYGNPYLAPQILFLQRREGQSLTASEGTVPA